MLFSLILHIINPCNKNEEQCSKRSVPANSCCVAGRTLITNCFCRRAKNNRSTHLLNSSENNQNTFKTLGAPKKSENQKPVQRSIPWSWFSFFLAHSDPGTNIFPCFDVLLVNRDPCSSFLDACVLPLHTDHEAFSTVSLDKIFTRAEVQLYGPISLPG